MAQGDRERNENGRYVETVTPDRVLAVLANAVDPFMATGDVADALGCSREAARLKLNELADRGEVERRDVRGAIVVWWPASGEPTDGQDQEVRA
ncbi:hypothetical protein [Halococcus salsus]|uniref:hypothetical protein n=1 Tax=Halococcus salsus TaxID=2162894 RepID=UPI00135B96CF|nr:hypothetical protein [Halococcus salsus]